MWRTLDFHNQIQEWTQKKGWPAALTRPIQTSLSCDEHEGIVHPYIRHSESHMAKIMFNKVLLNPRKWKNLYSPLDDVDRDQPGGKQCWVPSHDDTSMSSKFSWSCTSWSEYALAQTRSNNINTGHDKQYKDNINKINSLWSRFPYQRNSLIHHRQDEPKKIIKTSIGSRIKWEQ